MIDHVHCIINVKANVKEREDKSTQRKFFVQMDKDV